MRRLACALAAVGLVVLGDPQVVAQTDPFQSNPGPPPVAPANPAPAAPAPASPAPQSPPRQIQPPPRVARPEPEPVVPAPAVAEPVLPGERPVASGANSPIGWHGSWDRNCIARAVSVDVIEQPKHGTVTIRDETGTIPAKAGVGNVPPQCIGQTIMGKRIYYKSQSGFRGDDRVVVRVSIPIRSFERTIDIAVR